MTVVSGTRMIGSIYSRSEKRQDQKGVGVHRSASKTSIKCLFVNCKTRPLQCEPL